MPAVKKTAAKKRASSSKTVTHFITPALAKGEIYAGIIVTAGKPTHHLVLLAGEKTDVNHKAAEAWAKKQKGELPTRREQALLFANCKEHFAERAYWSAETHASGADYAWSQDFSDGIQFFWRKVNQLRARAVRRVAI